MTAKIHINLSQGILEVEGEPDFVREIYDDFKTDLSELSFRKNTAQDNNLRLAAPNDGVINVESNNEQGTQNSEPKKKAKARAASKKESYSFLKHLNTGPQGDADSIFGYIDDYKPKTTIEKNVVFMKYLQDQHAGEAITYDHIYTCYHNAGITLPKNLYESIKSTANASKGYGYIDRSNAEDLKLIYKAEVLLQKLKQ